MTPTDLLTVAEAAKLAGVSRAAMHKAVDNGWVPSVAVRVKATRIRRKDATEYRDRPKAKTKQT